VVPLRTLAGTAGDKNAQERQEVLRDDLRDDDSRNCDFLQHFKLGSN